MKKGQVVYYVKGFERAYVAKGEYNGEFKKGCKIVDRVNFDSWKYVDGDCLFTERQDAVDQAVNIMRGRIDSLQKHIDKLLK